METKTQIIDNIRVISLEGNIVLEETAELREAMEPFIEDNKTDGIILNCEKVSFIDSSGLGLIVSIYKTLMKTNRKFALSCLSKKNEDVFILTKLNNVLTITDTDQEALATMK